MANIFLSYDRDDEARARSIAKLLEQAGHSVWWDRQIKGGGEFSAEIEAALAQADKIVVLWSEEAVRSAWVRDEAAVGRDTGRLVPISIDGIQAPLGFRQFQTIDLSKWKGRGAPSEIDDLLSALKTPGRAPAPVPKAEGRRAKMKLGRPVMLGGGAIVAAAVAATTLWHFSSMNTAVLPTVTVMPADNSPPTQEFAHDLSIRVNNLPGSDSSNFRLVETDPANRGPADLTLKAGSDSGAQRRELTLTLGRDGAMLWSASFDQQAGQSKDLAQQAAVGAQRALSCVSEAMTYRRERIDAQTLKKYLASCTRYDNAYGANTYDPSIADALLQVIATAPHFEPAWAKLLAVETDGLIVVDDTPGMVRQMRQQIQRAQALGIDIAEMYVAKSALLSPSDFLGIFRIFDEGLKRHPDSALLYRMRGERWQYVGRMNAAVADTARAVQIEPLSPANQQTLASVLAYSGNTDAAYAQLRKAEQLWPGAATVIGARYRLDLRYGDPKEALAISQQSFAQIGGIGAGQVAFMKARANPTPANIDRAIDEDRKVNAQFPPFISNLIQSLGYFGHKDEAIDLLLNYKGGERIGLNAEVLFRPALRDVWRDPRSMAAAAHVGLLHYWKVSGNWPDFCFDPTLPYDCRKEAAKYRV